MVDLNLFEGNSQKQYIFDVLAKYENLTAKEVHRKLKSSFGKNFTYQSTFKVMGKMVERGILTKENLKYSLNVDWVINQRGKLDRIVTKSRKGQPSSRYYSENIKIIRMYDLKELDNFIQENVLKLNKQLNEKLSYWKVPHCWWLLGYPIEEDQLIQSYSDASLKTHALITCNTPLDKKAKQYYEKKGRDKVNVVHFDDDCEVVQVIGDYVFLCELPESVRQELNDFYNNTTIGKVDLPRILEIISKKVDLELKIIKNKNLAKMYAKQIKEGK